MKIPTAKEFYDKHYSDDCVVIMRDFAKLHVEAALKAASEDAQVIQQDALKPKQFEKMKDIIARLKAVENLPAGEYTTNILFTDYIVTSVNTKDYTVIVENNRVNKVMHLSELLIEEQAVVLLSLYRFLR